MKNAKENLQTETQQGNGNMLRFAMVVIGLLMLVTWLNAEIDFNDFISINHNPKLYQELQSKAENNLQVLPNKQGRQYRKYLKKHPDLLMTYLIAYELSGVLAEANPEHLMQNYLHIKSLGAKEDFSIYTVEFFLSYIAKQTVSDERISNYRNELWQDGLKDVFENSTDLTDRYRKVSLWCVENLRFKQTSGRDQTPLDITQKSYFGRCEEMQILFVAACRVVGIPSRPASTPWWAHQDNNHAWAEVFLDGKWHYTGDMDSAYYPNQTWFSGLIDKTVLILADGSLPAADDEVLVQGDSDSVINSTRNYAGDRSRYLKIQVLDENGDPVPKASVAVQVYNWGSLRSLVSFAVDESGEKTFTIGRGACFLSVWTEDGKKALVYIESNEQSKLFYKITVRETYLQDQNRIMEYPSNPFQHKQAPEAWNMGVQAANSTWNEKSQKDRPLPNFVAKDDSLFKKVWTSCRNNTEEFEAFSRKFYPFSVGWMDYLISDDEKFLWQADRKQFAALYRHYNNYSGMSSKYKDTVFRAVISPSVHYEELPWASSCFGRGTYLFPSNLLVSGKTDIEKITRIISLLKKRYAVDSSKALRGLIRFDLAYKQKYLNSYQFKILAVSAIRANGIPANFTRVPDVINIFHEGDWKFYNVMENKLAEGGADATNGKIDLKLTNENGGPLKVSTDVLVLSIYRNGGFYPVNQSFNYIENGRYEGEFPEDDYYLQIGYRISDSKTAYQILPVNVSASESQSVNLQLVDYPSTWNPIEPYLKPILDEITESGYSIVVIGNYTQENSIRVMDKLKTQNQSYILLGYDQAESMDFPYQVSRQWLNMVQNNRSNAMRTLTLKLGKDGNWQFYEGLWDKLPD